MSTLEFVLAVAIYGGITSVLNALLARRSQIDTWAEANPKRAAALKLLRGIGLDPWMIVQALALWFKGRLPHAVRNGSVRPPPPFVVLQPEPASGDLPPQNPAA